MKRLGFVACIALGIVTGCHKTEQEKPLPEIDDSIPAAVQFGIGTPSIEVVSKGAGAIDDWNNNSVNIIGIKRGEAFDDETSYLIDNKSGLASGDKITIVDEDNNPYFYEDYKVYDFYGYHVGTDDELTLVKDEKSVYITDLEIDGSQDLLCAKADPYEDIKYCSDPRGVSLERDRVYSSYAARRSVHPTLLFKHLLTRFQFFIVDGNNGRGETKVIVNRIKMESRYKCTMDIAPEPGIRDIGEEVKKMELNIDKKPAENYVSPTSPGDAKVNNSLILMPGSPSHKMIIEMSVVDNPAKEYSLNFELNFSDLVNTDENVYTFQPGKQYNIILVVYGPESVKITPFLDEWDDADNDITIYPDDF